MEKRIDFRALGCMILGALVASLIALPLVFNNPEAPSRIWLLLPALLMGALVGYRKRHSTFFFYFCLLAVLALSTLLMRQMG